MDRRHDPASAEVSLRFYAPELDKSAVLTRNVKNPRAFILAPDDPEIRGIIEEVAGHPELTLTRREIIKYIIVEAGQRSKEIQELLKNGVHWADPWGVEDGLEQAHCRSRTNEECSRKGG